MKAVSLCKTLRFPIFCYCTFLYRSILGVLCFLLCFSYLRKPQTLPHEFFTNEQLVALTKDLTDMLRKNRTIDWNRREAERANMRRLVKRLLKKYKYPPEEAEGAMNIVLKQCEQWAENQDVA